MTTYQKALSNLAFHKSQGALWQLGFRPFFLIGCAFAPVSLVLWLWIFTRGSGTVGMDIFWHAHEMLYGFVTAIIVGFLFTASQNWTGLRGIHGMSLAAIVAVWVAGRVVLTVPTINPYIVAFVDLAFLPIATGSLVPRLVRSGQQRNLIFVILLAILWLTNLFYHLDRLGIWLGTMRPALHSAMHTIVLMMVVIGGRVLPFFSERAIPNYQRRSMAGLNIAALLSVILFTIAYLWQPTSILTGTLALIAAVLNFVRLGGWYDSKIWHVPILWILYAGYLWIAVGLLLSGLASFSLVAPSSAIHAFTAGAMGTMIIGMVSRVSLGHTGRKITASGWTTTAYIGVLLGSTIRVFAPMLRPESYAIFMIIAGVFWVAAFCIILGIYAPILVAPRIDGRPG